MKRVNRFFFLMLLSGFLMAFSSTAQAGKVIVIKKRPPAVKVEVKTHRPFKNAVWVKGHWQWKKGNFVWTKGKWIKPRNGFVWVPAHWKSVKNGHKWVPGHWKRV